MMSARLAILALLAVCGAAVVTGADATPLAASANAAGQPAWTQQHRLAHSWSLAFSPAPGDLELAEVSFRGPRHRRLTAGSLRVAVRGALGSDYLVAGAVGMRAPAGPRALVLLVNRPSPLADPASVVVRVTARRSLGRATVYRLADPLSDPHVGLTPALCDIPLRGEALAAVDLASLGSRGAALAGFGGLAALAQAYDLACGLPSSPAFAQAVRGSMTSCGPAGTPGALCCPPNAICATPPTPGAPAPPTPVPPLPGPPGCASCNPRPGYACPLRRSPSVCAVSADSRPLGLASAH